MKKKTINDLTDKELINRVRGAGSGFAVNELLKRLIEREVKR